MIERIRFLMELGCLSNGSEQLEQYERIYEAWLNIETLFMFYIKKRKSALIERILHEIDAVKWVETETLTELIRKLNLSRYRKKENEIYSRPVLVDAVFPFTETKERVNVEFQVESCGKKQDELLIGFSDGDTIILTDDKIQVKFWLKESTLILKEENGKSSYSLPDSIENQPLKFIVEIDCLKSEFCVYLVKSEKKISIVKEAQFNNREEKINHIKRFIFSADYLSLYHITDIHFVS